MYIKRGDEEIPARTHRMVEIKTGEILGKVSGGGGGVGDPAERDPAAVLDDVINEYVSVRAALETYKVVIDPDTLELDEERTAELRDGA